MIGRLVDSNHSSNGLHNSQVIRYTHSYLLVSIPMVINSYLLIHEIQAREVEIELFLFLILQIIILNKY